MPSPGEPIQIIDAVFTRYTRRHHFYLKDLRCGQEWELGAPRAFPIGSCFKLAVLMAAFDVLDADEMNRPVVIEPGQFSIGVGVVNLLDSAITLTPHQMCQLMLTASDGTATDWLIGRIGLDRVDAMLRAHAPQSHLARNLNDMVAGFWALPEAATCKQRDWDDASLDDFTSRTAELGATQARDLAALVHATWSYQPQKGMEDLYRRCIGNRKRSIPRTEMYFAGAALSFTKTGSLGFRFFIQDGGVVLDVKTGRPIAAFAHTSAGWSLPQYICDTICGEIGLHILDLLGLDRSHSPDRTPLGAQMLHGQI